MKKLLIFFCLISVISYGQSGDGVHSIIDIQKTEKHINIPGTKMYIVPPPGFSISTDFHGLQKGSSVIFVYDIAGSSFKSNEPSFDRERFEQKGLTVYDARNIKVDGFDGKYLFMQNDSLSSAYLVLFGDSSFSTMIIATYPKSDGQTDKDIAEALNSIYYEKIKKVDPFETAQFILDDTVTKLKFCKYVGILYIYTLGGVEDKTGKENPMVIVTQLPLPTGGNPKSIAEQMLSKTESQGFKINQITNSTTMTINGYDGYEAEVHGDLDNKKTLIYQLVVTNGNNVIAIQGVDEGDEGKWLNEFKLLAHSVKFK